MKAKWAGFLFLLALMMFFTGCTETTEVAEKTVFRSMFDEVTKELSLDGKKIYVVDEKSYNEEEISFYISVMAEKDVKDITKADIENYMEQAFLFKEHDGVVCLVKKDNSDLIMECGSMKKHNMLDRNLMGITHPSVDEKSRGFYISQNNPEFLDMPYGTSSVARSGCGPIALTMAINYVAEEERTTLSEVIDWTLENDLYVPGSGTKWTLMSAYPPVVGLKGREVFTSDFETFKSLLKEGSVVVTSMKKGHFTDNGHFIVILPEKDGKVSVLDPASITRTLEEWDAELIFDESKKGFYVISK
ncbi:MAG: C39 family peptidase [Clostridia bacterium]|nr:C39 family peptidase [Clostridia bacterium]